MSHDDGSPDARIERLLAELAANADPATHAKAQALVAAVLEWHRDGLARIVELSGKPTTVDALANDPRVASLLVLHGLHPASPKERVEHAVAKVNAELRGLGGIARTVPDVEPTTVELSYETASAAAAGRMQALLREALDAAAPDADVAIRVLAPEPGLVPIAKLLERRTHADVVAAAPTHDVCEACGVRLDPRHAHLVNPETRTLQCACQACALALSARTSGPWRVVPPRATRLHDVAWSDDDWERLNIPIGLAFFLRSGATGTTHAFYPSPAGAVESDVAREVWGDVVRANPMLSALEPDVEALLVRRLGPLRDHYRVSVDHAYALVGILRRGWRGLGGGAEVWRDVARFFDDLVPEEAVRA